MMAALSGFFKLLLGLAKFWERGAVTRKVSKNHEEAQNIREDVSTGNKFNLSAKLDLLRNKARRIRREGNKGD